MPCLVIPTLLFTRPGIFSLWLPKTVTHSMVLAPEIGHYRASDPARFLTSVAGDRYFLGSFQETEPALGAGYRTRFERTEFTSRRRTSLARSPKKRNRMAVKDMKYKHDPMIRFYERTQDWLQEKGRPFVIIGGGLIGLLLLYTAGYYLFSYRESRANAAYAEAYEKYNAPINDGATTTQILGRSYSDEKLKWQEAAEAFERVASSYSSYYKIKAKYMAGVCYLHIDRDRGLRLIQECADAGEQPTADLARLAIAENYASNGQADMALGIFENLLNSKQIPRQVIQLSLGHVYERLGDTQKATEAFFEVCQADRTSAAGSEAEKRLSAVAPDRLKELPTPGSTPPGE